MYRSLMTCLCASQSRGAGVTAGGSCSGGPSDEDEDEVGVVPSGEGVDMMGLSTQATWWTGCMVGRAAEAMTLIYPGLLSISAGGWESCGHERGLLQPVSRQSGDAAVREYAHLRTCPACRAHKCRGCWIFSRWRVQLMS